MLVFYLFRTKLYRSGLAPSQGSRRDWIGDFMRQQPEAEIGRGRRWRIGNVTSVGGRGLLLSVATPEPAYALYDSEYGLLSLAPPKPARASGAVDMARGLQALLNAHARTHHDLRIEIDAVIDPEGFIDHIMDAFAVTEFTVQCGEPDVRDDGHAPFAPMQAMLEAAGGTRARTSILGEDLDREMLERLTRAAAGDGHEVRIRLKEAMGQRPVSRHMRGHTIDFLVRKEDIPGRADTVLAMARQIFLHIRGGDAGAGLSRSAD